MLGPTAQAEHFGGVASVMMTASARRLQERPCARAADKTAATGQSASAARPHEGEKPPAAQRLVLLIAEMPLLEDGLMNLLQEKCRDISFMRSDPRSQREPSDVRPDLVIMNTEQERLTGKWVRTQMENLHAAYKDAPVLLISGLDMSVEAKNAIEAGFAGFVPSTQSSDQLIAAIRLILAGGRFYLHLDQGGKGSNA